MSCQLSGLAAHDGECAQSMSPPHPPIKDRRCGRMQALDGDWIAACLLCALNEAVFEPTAPVFTKLPLNPGRLPNQPSEPPPTGIEARRVGAHPDQSRTASQGQILP